MRGLPGAYVDSCVLLWVSHWVLVEFAAVVAVGVRRGELTASRGTTINAEFAGFRQERLSLLEPRGVDFLQAMAWLERSIQPRQTPAQPPPAKLRAADALHLAISQRHGLELTSADGELIQAAEHHNLPCCWIRA